MSVADAVLDTALLIDTRGCESDENLMVGWPLLLIPSNFSPLANPALCRYHGRIVRSSIDPVDNVTSTLADATTSGAVNNLLEIETELSKFFPYKLQPNGKYTSSYILCCFIDFNKHILAYPDVFVTRSEFINF